MKSHCFNCNTPKPFFQGDIISDIEKTLLWNLKKENGKENHTRDDWFCIYSLMPIKPTTNKVQHSH